MQLIRTSVQHYTAINFISGCYFIYLMLNGGKKHQGSAGNLHQQPTYCNYKIIYNYKMFN